MLLVASAVADERPRIADVVDLCEKGVRQERIRKHAVARGLCHSHARHVPIVSFATPRRESCDAEEWLDVAVR